MIQLDVELITYIQSVEVDILGVNALHCLEDRIRNCSVTYRLIQVEYVSTNNQQNELRRKLKSTGIVVEIQQKKSCSSSITPGPNTEGLQYQLLIIISIDEAETKLIQYWIKDEVGALACTQAVFQIRDYPVT